MELASTSRTRANHALGDYPLQYLQALVELGMTRDMLRRYFRTDDRQLDSWSETYGLAFPDRDDFVRSRQSLRAGRFVSR